MNNYAHSLPDTKNNSNWHLLSEHLRETGRLAGEFAKHFGAGAEVLAQQAGLLHDLGKYSAEFQQRLQGDPTRVDHSTAGAQEALARYPKLGYLIAYAIAGHHTGLANGKGFDGQRRSLAERLKLKSPTLSKVWQQEITLVEEKDFHKCLQGMTRCEDQHIFQCAFLIRMLFSCLVDADRLDTEMFYAKAEGRAVERGYQHLSLLALRTALDRHLRKFAQNSASQLNAWRNKILTTVRAKADLDRGLFSLTVPTGGGKTLTSLAFALDHAIQHKLRRVIYVIPYTNIIEQTAEIFRQALGKKYRDTVLEHHSSFSVDDRKLPNPEHYQGRAKLKLAMENWDAPIIVTTAVQFFESLFSARTASCRKLHNISNSVIILDEVQTTPLHVLRPCIAAVNELARNYQCSVVLCTATQPALTSKEFTDRFENVRELAPERTGMFKFFKRVSIDTEIKKWTDDTLLQKISEQEQVLCIVNNRKHARSLVDNLQACHDVYLLTTLMCAKHRQQVLGQIRASLSDNKPCRVVATSLIEAGVDVDFPAVFRAEAGLDSIVQAAGRCNREGTLPRDKSKVIIFMPQQQWKPPHELRQFIQIAQDILRRGGDPLDHTTMQNYFRKLYWQRGQQQLDSKGILKNLQSEKLDSLPFEKIAHDFKLIEDNQQPLIVSYDAEAEKLLNDLQYVDRCGEIARKLQPYLVQVPHHVYNQMQKARQLEFVGEKNFAKQFAVLAAKDNLYHADYGLGIDDRAVMPTSSCLI